jgi:hypothetical protein
MWWCLLGRQWNSIWNDTKRQTKKVLWIVKLDMILIMQEPLISTPISHHYNLTITQQLSCCLTIMLFIIYFNFIILSVDFLVDAFASQIFV